MSTNAMPKQFQGEERRTSRVDRPRLADSGKRAAAPIISISPSPSNEHEDGGVDGIADRLASASGTGLSQRTRSPSNRRQGQSYVYIRGYSPAPKGGDRSKRGESEESRNQQRPGLPRSKSSTRSPPQSRSKSPLGLVIPKTSSPFGHRRILSPGGIDWSNPSYGEEREYVDVASHGGSGRRRSSLPNLGSGSNSSESSLSSESATAASPSSDENKDEGFAAAAWRRRSTTKDPLMCVERAEQETLPRNPFDSDASNRTSATSQDVIMHTNDHPEHMQALPFAGNSLMVEADKRPKHKNVIELLRGHGNGQTTSFHFEKMSGPKDGDYGFIIEQIEDQDDIDHMPVWKRTAFKMSPIFLILSQVAFWIYIALRARYTLDAQDQANEIFPMAWLFMVVEIGVAVPGVLHQLWSLFLIKRRNRPKLRIRGDDVPSVDFFVCCCREDIDVILDTTRAACAMDYPLDRFRIMVLDDGKDAELQRAIENLAATQFPNLSYHSRPILGKDFKAGNMNFGLEETLKMAGGASEYTGSIDADMIPEENMLRALVPHLLFDKRMSMACAPQLFYNVPVNDPLAQSLDYFVHVSEPIKDTLGTAWFTGSGALFKREALDEIGGFPLGSLAEDVCCSSILLGKGWKTSYVHEPLQFGQVPDSYIGHLKQRARWTIGTLQTAMKLRLCLSGEYARHMTFFQRFCGFVYTCSSFFTMFLTMSIFTMPIVLVSGGTMVAFVDTTQLQILVRMAFAVVALNRMNEFFIFLPSGYFTGRRESFSSLWMAVYQGIAIIRAFMLPTWLGGTNSAFKSSGSQKSALNERDALHRAHVWRRIWVFLTQYTVWFHVAYISFVIASIILSTVRCFTDWSTLTLTGKCLLVHGGWPPLLWITALGGMLKPITYCLFPPDMPDREELLIRDPKTGVAHPKPEWKKLRVSWVHWINEFFYTGVFLISAAYFIGSFIV